MALKLSFTPIFTFLLIGCTSFVSVQFMRVSPYIPGKEVTFECTTCGPSSTRYNVTGCPFELLNLLHTNFHDGGTNRMCRTMVNATARSVSTNGICYTSNLTVSALPDTAVTVECYHDDGENNTLIGRTTLGQLPPTYSSQPFLTFGTTTEPATTSISSTSSEGLSDAWIAVVTLVILVILVVSALVIGYVFYRLKCCSEPVRRKNQRTETVNLTDCGSRDLEMRQVIRSEMQSAVREFHAELEKKDCELRRKLQELDQKNDIILNTQKKLDENDHKLREVVGNNNKLTEENTSLNLKVQTLTQENSQLRQRLSDLEKEAKELKTKVATMSEEKEELQKLRVDIQNLNNEKASQEDVEKVQRELQNLRVSLPPELLNVLRAVAAEKEEKIVTSISQTTCDKGSYKNGHNSGHGNLHESTQPGYDHVITGKTHRSISDDNNDVSVESKQTVPLT